MEQICFRGEPLKNRHGHSRRVREGGIRSRFFPSRVGIFAIVLKDELGKKERAFEIRQRIAETLRGVHSAQGVEVGRIVFAYAHGTDFNTEGTETKQRKEKKTP